MGGACAGGNCASLCSCALGRFITPDDGSDQDAADPQRWNLYSYVRNNPASNVDPDGHTCVTTDNGTMADNMDGKGCAQLNDADQVVHVSAGLSTADLVGDSIVDQSAGRWFVGFGNLMLNGKASGLRDMAAGMAVGALAIAGAGEGKAGEEPTTIGPDLRWGDPAKLKQRFLDHGGDFEARTAG